MAIHDPRVRLRPTYSRTGLTKPGVLLLVAAGVVALLGLYQTSQIDFPVRDAPLELSRAGSTSFTFQTVDASTYEVCLASQYRPELDREEQSALLLNLLDPADGGPVISAELFAQGEAVETRDVSSEFRRVECMEHTLLWFDAVPGASYRLDVEVARPTTQLETTRPAVRVQLPIAYLSTRVEGTFYVFCLALAAAGFGLLLVVLDRLLAVPVSARE